MSTPPDRPPKHSVVGVGISVTSYGDVVRFYRQWVDQHRSGEHPPRARYICVTSVHGVITARDQADVRRILNAADIATPDGMPLVWALRSFGIRSQQRVYGPRLMLELCQNAALHGDRVFLYGGSEEALTALCTRLRAEFRGIRIVGRYSPPFRPLTPAEDSMVRSLIADSQADVVFVGISTPKQERWMDAHRDSFPGAVLIGVGAAFDFHAGRVRQAPEWMQRSGLEWLFRLLMEPARLWRRYLTITPRFLPLWAAQRFLPQAMLGDLNRGGEG